MDNIKLYIIKLDKIINELRQVRKTDVKELKKEQKKLDILQTKEKILNYTTTNINEVINLANNKMVFIIKDELFLLLIILLDVLLLTLTSTNLLFNVALTTVVDSILVNLQIYNNKKNKKLINYYKDINNINPKRNVNITNRTIKKHLFKMLSSKKSADQDLINTTSQIQDTNQKISTIKKKIAQTDEKIRTAISKRQEATHQRETIIDKLIADDKKVETSINHTYQRSLKKKNT